MTALGSDFWTPFWSDFWKKDRIVLAPMEGVVDWVMRDLLTRIGGVDLCVTEFIRVTDQLLPDATFLRDCPELKAEGFAQTRTGVPVVVQLLGGKPEWMAKNAARAAQLGAPAIDINFGCPAKTVNRHDGGAALLKDPVRIHDVVRAVREAVPAYLPVSAKVRLGFSNKDQHLEIAHAAQSGGAAWLTVHARTRDEGYRPPAHWEFIARMREAIQIPVIANGDIWSKDDYLNCRGVTGARHVMMGRGLMMHPSLGREIQGLKSREANWQDHLNWLHEFGQMSREFRHDHYGVCRTKQWLKNIAKRFPDDGGRLFESIKRLEDLDPILSLISNPVEIHESEGF